MSDPASADPPRLQVPETGDARVDAALRRVDDLDDVPVDEHAERLGTAHADLQQVLREPDGPSDTETPAVPHP